MAPSFPARTTRPVRVGLALVGLLLPAVAVLSLPAPSYAGTACGTPLAMGDCTAPEARIYSAKAAPNGGLSLDPGEETTSDFVEFYMSTKAVDPDGDKVTFDCQLARGATVVVARTDCTEDDPTNIYNYSRGNVEYTGLVPGDYTFSAWATDAATNLLGGPAPNEQETPSTFSWKVVEPTNDVTPPNTRFTATPKRWHLSPFASEEYDADEPLKSAVCTLQGSVRTCDRSQAALRVTSGDWTFTVAGVDFAGNRDRTPAVNRFTVPVPSNKLRAAGGWSKGSGPSYFFNGYSTTKKKGATLSAARAGTRSVALVATKCPGCGTVTVSYGSKVLKKVSLAASSKRHRQLIPITSWSTGHGGRVTIKVVSSGKPVTIEGLGFSKRG